MTSLEQQIACVKREIGMREFVYPGRVTAKKMSQAKADQELQTMRDVLATLELANVPHTVNFLEAHDRAKEPQDWYWLVGYLAGKALRAHMTGDQEKALHHTISTTAVLANWHAAISLADTRMSPGSSDLQAFLEKQFGEGMPTG